VVQPVGLYALNIMCMYVIYRFEQWTEGVCWYGIRGWEEVNQNYNYNRR